MNKTFGAVPRQGAAVLLVVAVLAVGLGGCEKPPAMPDMVRPPSPVTVAPVIVRDVPDYRDEIGKCVPYELVAIQPQVSGQITQIHFTDGADLQPGAPLFTIDPRPYQAALNQALAALAESQAMVEFAKVEQARVEKLRHTNAISQEDFDTKKNAVDVAAARLLSSQAAVETARLNLQYCQIASPIQGRAGQRLVDLGNVVIANNPMASTSLLTIQRLDPIYVEFSVTENQLAAVRQNMQAGALAAQVALPDSALPPRTGKLTFLDNAVQEGTGTIKLRATLENADHQFWPGQFVKVRLILHTEMGALLVPAVAVQPSARGPFIYVLKDDQTAEMRPVEPGQRHGESIVLEKGVKAGELVITSGQMLVMPGAKVHVVEPTELPGAGAPATAPTTAPATRAGGRS